MNNLKGGVYNTVLLGLYNTVLLTAITPLSFLKNFDGLNTEFIYPAHKAQKDFGCSWSSHQTAQLAV